jgi:hypothetical protein
MQYGGKQGGRPHGQMFEHPAVTHVILSHITKHLIYQLKPNDETVIVLS